MCDRRYIFCAKAVPICVFVPDGGAEGALFIDFSVAIVVLFIAGLKAPWVGLGSVIVAI